METKEFSLKTKNDNLERSHSAEIFKRENPLGFWHFSLLQNIKKTRRGPFGDIKKFSKKVSVEKIQRGTLYARPVS